MDPTKNSPRGAGQRNLGDAVEHFYGIWILVFVVKLLEVSSIVSEAGLFSRRQGKGRKDWEEAGAAVNV